MGLEAATHINQLVSTNPIGAADPKSQGDDHLRLIKGALVTDFPNIGAPVTGTPAQLNALTTTANLTPLLNALDPFTLGQAKFKTADTARVSTVALANDPDLVVALAANATYRYEVRLPYRCVTTFAQQIKVAMVYSGTRNIHVADIITNSGGLVMFVADIVTGIAQLETGFVNTPSAADFDNSIRYDGLIRTINAGNLQVQWAQANSNANATTVRQGASIVVTRIA
jgi:hypothetical protein